MDATHKSHSGLAVWLGAATVTLVAAILRLRFLSGMELSAADPWRHLQLLENVQRGLGFTLFEGQPYLWYQPTWHLLVGTLGLAQHAAWVAGLLSAAAVGLFCLFVRRWAGGLRPPLVAGAMLAGFGPAIAFTCGTGPEALAFFLLVVALLVSTYRGPGAALVSGLVFGVAVMLRVNLLFNGPLLLPDTRRRGDLALFLGGLGTVFGLTWLRNFRIIREHAWVFTWDGLATRAQDYNLLTTLIPQMHPAVSEGLTTLHREIVPRPGWLFEGPHIAWGTAFFILAGAVSVALTLRWRLIVAAFVPLVWFNVFDSSLSTHFFRLYLGMFPVLILGFAALAERIAKRHGERAGHVAGALAALVVVAAGLSYTTPRDVPSLTQVTPPFPLPRTHYMVNSGFYHPESLIYRYPDKRFIGMPLEPAHFEEFARHFPRYTSIVWHRTFSVQDELLKHLLESGAYRVAGQGTNVAGVPYLLLEKDG